MDKPNIIIICVGRQLGSGGQIIARKLAEEFGKASDCIGCGQCEEMCPQHLPIVDTLEKVAEHYEH